MTNIFLNCTIITLKIASLTLMIVTTCLFFKLFCFCAIFVFSSAYAKLPLWKSTQTIFSTLLKNIIARLLYLTISAHHLSACSFFLFCQKVFNVQWLYYDLTLLDLVDKYDDDKGSALWSTITKHAHKQLEKESSGKLFCIDHLQKKQFSIFNVPHTTKNK